MHSLLLITRQLLSLGISRLLTHLLTRYLQLAFALRRLNLQQNALFLHSQLFFLIFDLVASLDQVIELFKFLDDFGGAIFHIDRLNAQHHAFFLLLSGGVVMATFWVRYHFEGRFGCVRQELQFLFEL